MSFASLRSAVALFVLCGLIIAGILFALSSHSSADFTLLLTLIVGSFPVAWDVAQSIMHRHFGVDIIAIVAIVVSLFLHQYLAGSVILLMLSGGEALETFALKTARRELTELLKRVPTHAHRKEGSTIVDVPAESLIPGDVIVVKPGETLPVDGDVIEGRAMIDVSMLTGESMLVEALKGQHVMSGSVNKDGVLHIRATLPSSESKYAQIIRLVRDAESKKAPFVRLADRYSVWFTGLTFLLALLAWFFSHDPLRVLAVLVVATPCPLILATPIAFASGISRSATRGIIVKHGGALEKLGEARSFAFDKTGTVTLGIPAIVAIEGITISEEKTLMLAASLDQLSAHILARALLDHARKQGLTLQYPAQFAEHMGDGVSGFINGTQYFFGRLRMHEARGIRLSEQVSAVHDAAKEQGKIAVYLADEKQLLGTVFFADTIRKDVQSLFRNLRTFAIEKTVMLTGDKLPIARMMAQEIGIPLDDVKAELLPEDKVREVAHLHEFFPPVVMVGDGINDAPAIAAADVGIALGSGGSTASSEAGDIVILVDKIERVGEALAIGHRVMHIAKQSIFVGIGFSLCLMIIASLGYITPVYGALLQEIVDVVVILNALRVLL